MEIDVIKMLNQLRNGEDVVCPVCGKGILRPGNGDCNTSLRFICDECDEVLRIN